MPSHVKETLTFFEGHRQGVGIWGDWSLHKILKDWKINACCKIFFKKSWLENVVKNQNVHTVFDCI